MSALYQWEDGLRTLIKKPPQREAFFISLLILNSILKNS